MGRKGTIQVQRKMTAEELEQRIKTLEKDTKVQINIAGEG
jgi:hypothetical protein